MVFTWLWVPGLQQLQGIIWLLLQKCSKKPSCSSCLPLLFTGEFPKIKCCWQKGLLKTSRYMSHWVCRLSALQAEAVQDTEWPVVGLQLPAGACWRWHVVQAQVTWDAQARDLFKGTPLVKRNGRNGTRPAWNLTARSMLQVDGGWKTTISGLVPKLHGVGNSSVLQKVLYTCYLFLGFPKVSSFGCCQHQVGHLNKKALNLPLD